MASNITIQDDDEFGRLLRGLAQDVVDAHIHWGQYQALHAQMEKSPQVTAEAHTFWHYTLVAHQRTTLMCLARVYENNQTGLHLRSWLIATRNHLHLFSKDQVARRRPDAYTGSNASHDRSTMTSLLVGMINCGHCRR